MVHNHFFLSIQPSKNQFLNHKLFTFHEHLKNIFKKFQRGSLQNFGQNFVKTLQISELSGVHVVTMVIVFMNPLANVKRNKKLVSALCSVLLMCRV